jgi:hypothetical protein
MRKAGKRFLFSAFYNEAESSGKHAMKEQTNQEKKARFQGTPCLNIRGAGHRVWRRVLWRIDERTPDFSF